jgi:predicted nucleic acid-binding Zn ribbon protein
MDERPLQGLIEKVLFDLKKQENSPKNRLIDVWIRLVGPRIARHTKPYALKNKNLFVRVDDSTWAFELSTKYRATLLKRLQNALGEENVANLYFKVGEL